MCKYPEKTKKRREALSSHEQVATQSAKLLRHSVEEDDAYPVHRVRALRAVPPPLLPNAAASGSKPLRSESKDTTKHSSANNYPSVPSAGSTILSYGAKTNYVGPGILRSRAQGLKRTASGSSNSTATGSEGDPAKRQKIDYSAATNGASTLCSFTSYKLIFTGHRIGSSLRKPKQAATGFKVPFKTPFKTPSEAAGSDPPDHADETLDTIKQEPDAAKVQTDEEASPRRRSKRRDSSRASLTEDAAPSCKSDA